MQVLTNDNFKQVVETPSKTVLVDFYADWCMPCKMLAPVLEEIARENDQVTVCKVDVSQSPELAVQFDVKNIPCLISFKDGKMHRRAMGVQPKTSILALLD